MIDPTFNALNLPPILSRPDGRKADELRKIEIIPDFAPYALGSVLIRFGLTQVICAVTIEDKVPVWMHRQNVPGGWITAEYSMLPYSTLDRKQRDISKGKADGRTIEIQRLIGRSLRAAIDLQKMHGKTLWIDCDVLQADGGTRTASITGAYVAAKIAIDKLLAKGKLAENPIIDSVAAVSVGKFEGFELLDLCYLEDRDAEVDANLVMTGSGRIVEMQACGEESTFTESELAAMLKLGRKGIEALTLIQKAASIPNTAG
jgi:ribonuclease PH